MSKRRGDFRSSIEAAAAELHMPSEPAALAHVLSSASAEDAARRIVEVTRLLDEREAEVRRREERLEVAGQEMQQRQIQWRQLVDFAPTGFLVTDGAALIVEANHAAATLLERPREFLIGKPLGLLVDQQDRGHFYACLAELQRDRGTAPRQMVLRLPAVHAGSGRSTAISASVTPMSEATSRARIYRWSLTDCTEFLQAEETLDAQRHFSDSVFDTAPVFIVVLDRQGLILRLNAHLRSALKTWAEGLFDQPWPSLFVDADQDPLRMAFVKALDSGLVEQVKARLEAGDGVRRSMIWHIKRLARPLDRSCAIAVGHDIGQLEEAQEKAIRAERLAAIGQMMSMLAHESRNALQRTQACLERLRWRMEDRSVELDLIDRVQAAQRDLTRLFDDLRHFTAPLQLSVADCDLSEIWHEAWSQATSVKPGRTAVLHDDCHHTNLRCTVDRFRFVQVFRNLFDNAFEASLAPLELWITCDEADGCLAVHTRDNGPGLSEEAARRLFDPFFTTKTKGSGLGMAIAKRVLDAHGGRIDVRSPANAPAEFLLTIPRRPS